ncbi:DUF551 domain-containing protein [Yersinia enterocolitica]|uniref:DUF551 domain-containing protein n=1 Tax=Yersinia enterocolitica TaxID=630 RepID=UPI003F474871
MKELDSFTVERLEEIIAEEGYSAMITPKNDEVRALARIALAAKRAEPIYQYHTGIINEEGDIDWYWVDCDKGFYSQYDNQHRRIVYTTPQLNSQQGWIKCSDQMPENDEFVRIWPLPDFGVELHVGQYIKFHKNGPGWFAQVYEYNYGVDFYPITVTNWMPLQPAPEKP